MNLVQMVDLWFRLDKEINKNAHICTASREIPVHCQSFGYPYKENIATHVQNKLWSINSAQKSFWLQKSWHPNKFCSHTAKKYLADTF